MKNSYQVESEPLTPEIVLDIIKDFYIQSLHYDPDAEPDYHLTFNTTIEEWQIACNLVSTKKLGRALNDWFGIDYSDHEWQEALEPNNKKNLEGVCKMIASKSSRIANKPITIFDITCQNAGTFVALRFAFQEAGIPINDMKPSSKLEPMLKKHLWEFIQAVGTIAPNVLPKADIKLALLQKLGPILFAITLFIFAVNAFFTIPYLMPIGLSTGVLGVAFSIFGNKSAFKSVAFKEIETYNDLCQLINNVQKNSAT